MANLVYGGKYHIQNGYDSWSGGYLDTCGGGQGNLFWVSTSPGENRSNGSGTWKILSAATPAKQDGDPVLPEDLIHLQNMYNPQGAQPPFGGYLDTYGMGGAGKPCAGLLCVSTAKVPNRAPGSGSWMIFAETSGGPVQEANVVHLLNAYNDFTGGFLDTNGNCQASPTWCANCKSNLLCVTTSASWTRVANSGSTLWRFTSQ